MKYETIFNLVQSIIKTITNVSVAHFNATKKLLSTQVFKVSVQNPQTKMHIHGDVKVSNTKGLEDQLKNNALAIRELKKPIESEKKVRILNFDAIKFPQFPKWEFPKMFGINNFPKEYKISNFKELIPALKMMADNIKAMDIKPEVKVAAPVVNVAAPIVNVPAQKPPVVNVEKPDLSDITKIIEFLNELSPKKPLPVRLSDGKAFYNALQKMADIYAGSSFSAFQGTDGQDGRGVLNKNNELKATISETWSLNDVDTVNNGQFTYLGEETVDGQWRITQVQKIANRNVMHYATPRNNPALAEADYPAAWEQHADLDYGRVSEAL